MSGAVRTPPPYRQSVCSHWFGCSQCNWPGHKLVNGDGAFDISYNCFFNKTANFSGGYPGIYGIPIQNNHNGDLCDAFFNIFLDPRFLDTNTPFHPGNFFRVRLLP
jgi:hypothetical protein